MKVKPAREIHGDSRVGRRWTRLALIGGGTGVAPLIQIARALLADPEDATELWLVSVNRREEDALMREELDALVAASAASAPSVPRLRVSYSTTGRDGRPDAPFARAALPPARAAAGGDASTMVLVCGTDGFVGS